ncbi:MAG: WbqC family protein [Bacteroidota bacterium]
MTSEAFYKALLIVTYAVCAPEYFPRAAYVALMLSVDVFIVADTFQYSRQSYQNRTRIRTPQGTQWLSIPLRGGQHGRPIGAVERDPRFPWQRKHQKALVYNYRSAPYFLHYDVSIADVLSRDERHLLPILKRSLHCLVSAYRIETAIHYASEWEGEPRTLLEVAKHFNGATLVSLAGAFTHDAQQVKRIARFDYSLKPHRQNFEGFEANLSALDTLLNHGPDARRLVLDGIR